MFLSTSYTKVELDILLEFKAIKSINVCVDTPIKGASEVKRWSSFAFHTYCHCNYPRISSDLTIFSTR